MAGDKMRDEDRQAALQLEANARNNPLQLNMNPFGKAFGGPVDPPTSLPIPQMPIGNTFVAPRPSFSNVVALPETPVLPKPQVEEMALTSRPNYNWGENGNGANKIKSRERFREKRFGGIVNDGFKQYDTGSHDSGQDQTIDANGNPSGNASASIQNKENMYKVGGIPFIMSDVLKNPETNNTFNVDAAKINQKFPKARFNSDDKNTLDFQLGRLAIMNNKIKNSRSKEMAEGGPLDSYEQPVNPLAWNNNMATLPNLQLKPLTGISSVEHPAMVATQNPNTVLNSISERNSDDRRYNSITPEQAANVAAIGTKAFALGQSIKDATADAEVEKLILPDYAKANNYMREANIDYGQAKQDTIGVSNIGSQLNRSMSNNASVYQARQANRVGQLQDALGRINEAQNNAQSQLNITKGQYETNKAVDTANRQYQNQQGNMQNQARSRYADRLLASNLSQIGTEFNEYSVQQAEMKNRNEVANMQTQQAVQYLQAKYPSIQFTPENVEKFKRGELSLDQLIQVKV